MNSIHELENVRDFIDEILGLDILNLEDYEITIRDKDGYSISSNSCLSEYTIENYIKDGFPNYDMAKKVKKYWVTMSVTGHVTVEVDADSEEEALSLAEDATSWMVIDGITSSAEEIDQELVVDSNNQEVERQDS
tara:strand:- start:983 stop:1387 length:405 start_codon:yes stop_codon:yes gene_type:complete